MSEKQENVLLNLVVNIIIPTVIMTKFSAPDKLGPINSVMIGLAFPLSYGLYDLWSRKKVNFISILGVVSVLLTGAIVYQALSASWIAIKEATIPALIGIVVLVSQKSKKPIVSKLLLNEAIVNINLIRERLAQRQKQTDFEKLLQQSSYLLSAAFFLSAALNYILAKVILTAEPGTSLYTEQLGKMHGLSWPIIVLPSTAVMLIALWRLVSGLSKLTGLEMEAILKQQSQKDKAE